MSLLPHCPSCQGFNPPQQARCLHCDVSLSAPLSAPKSVSALLALGALGLVGCETMIAEAYGLPPSGYDYGYEDQDRDGVFDQDDCDDQDPEVGVANFGERCEETYPQLVSAEAGAEAGAQAGDETSSGGAPSEG
jgi:hypothetical protein